MTILTLDKKQLEEKIGKITKETEDKITMFGTPVEEVTDKEISIEIFPNRPDLLSLQGFSRSFLQYIGKKTSDFKVNNPERDYKVIIEKSVKQVRPFTACAIVKNLKFDDEKIKEIIDIQEKLHLTIGRKRKKIAIGIYPLEKIKLPIRFTALEPEKIKFQPLESSQEMSGRQILGRHPAGQEYGHLLKDMEKYPIFIDANDKILSMPPIINSHETGKISQETKEIFIECSGFNLEYLKKTLNILVSMFADMGGKIYAMEIKDSSSWQSPQLEPEELFFRIEDINKTLGLELSEKEIIKYLRRMGIECKKDRKKEKQLVALIPAYRADILHWIDLTEEVAIAYGYQNFKPEIPKISTIAEEDSMSIKKKTIAKILAGLGLLETSSFHLTTKKEIKKTNHTAGNFIEVEDSKTEYNTLRQNLITNLMKILSENSNAQYPQKIFELGKVFSLNNKEETCIEEKEKFAVAISGETNFTEMKQVLEYLMKALALEKELKIEEAEHPSFIPGRTAKILLNKKEIGIFGEISPNVLKNWHIKMPTVALEMEIDEI